MKEKGEPQFLLITGRTNISWRIETTWKPHPTRSERRIPGAGELLDPAVPEGSPEPLQEAVAFFIILLCLHPRVILANKTIVSASIGQRRSRAMLKQIIGPES